MAAAAIAIANAGASATAMKDGMEAAEKSINVYMQVIEKAINWQEFETKLKTLKEGGNYYSTTAADLVGDITTMLLDSRDAYRSSVSDVSSWCGRCVYNLDLAIKLFPNIKNTAVAKQQCKFLLTCLEYGEKMLDSSIKKLQLCFKKFNSADGKLLKLRAVLDHDFSDKSEFFQKAVDNLRRNAYLAAAAGIVGGPIGLAISYAITAGTVEGVQVPQLQKAFADTSKKFDELKAIAGNAKDKIAQARAILTAQIKVMTNLRDETTKTTDVVEGWAGLAGLPDMDFMRDAAKKQILSLKKLCEQYIAAEEKAKQDAIKAEAARQKAIKDAIEQFDIFFRAVT